MASDTVDDGFSFGRMVADGQLEPQSTGDEMPQLLFDSNSQRSAEPFDLTSHDPADQFFGGSELPDDLDHGSIGQGSNWSLVEGPTSRREDVAVPRADFQRLLFDAQLSALDDSDLHLPWETGVMKSIFDDSDSSWIASAVPPVTKEFASNLNIPAEGSAASSKSLDVGSQHVMPVYSYAIKIKPDRDVFQELEMLWKSAVDLWIRVFDILYFPGILGDSLKMALEFEGEDAGAIVVRDALGIKSPRTAVKRAQSLLRYFTGLQQYESDFAPWNKQPCLQFISAASKKGVVATRGTDLLETFRFAKYVMLIPIPDSFLNDPQLKGRAMRQRVEAAEYNPARTLKVAEVSKLERAMESDLNPIDKYLLGGVLFAIYSRSRWSDLRHVDQFWIERETFNGEPFGFVECRTKHHKTATSLLKKTRFMPLVAPLLGVTGVDWVEHWVQAMWSLGVYPEDSPFGAICKAPTPDGVLGQRSCTSEEIGTFVNGILKAEEQVTSHSLKHTTLEWCSSYGLEEDARTLLGHHELQGSKALTVYSRDMLTRPLQLYCSMLLNIRRDLFRPDETRTSRMIGLMNLQSQHSEVQARAGEMSRLTFPAAGNTHEGSVASDHKDAGADTPTVSVPDNLVSEDELSSADSSDSSDSSSDAGMPFEAIADARRIPGPLWRNKRSHVVHKRSELEGVTFCGRKINPNTFEYLEEGAAP